MAAALPECYHGGITKKECEEVLGKKNKDGAYLIRESETIQGALCLCVYKQKVVYTYRILQAHNGNYTLLTAGGLQETYFKTLGDLIRNYKRKNQGLAIHLRHSVKKKTPMLIQPPRRPETQPEAPATPPARRSAGGSAAASARGSAAASARGWGGASGGHSLQRGASPLPEEENDYENDPNSDYVEVIPD
ncbi:SH2 domain-containing protein 1B [Xiphophorus hellerii]|uniref:SH2 domain-containing protein 1B n=1 Tax=Xiphophorus hellerii TaxID=8084 RepID=UPI0013B3E2F8|nr:SH2 domain-containing protein 1B-like [Xiphophorus hellerii]